MVSFIHSSISSLLSLYFFWKTPGMLVLSDGISIYMLVEALNNLGESGLYQEYATLFTWSYIWYDLFDMLRSNGFNPFNMKEMMVHHSIMIGGGLIVMLDKIYGNFTLYGLNMEINSVFLHGRALLQMCNQRDTAAFRMVSGLNILVRPWQTKFHKNLSFRPMLLTDWQSTTISIAGDGRMALFTVTYKHDLCNFVSRDFKRLHDEFNYRLPQPEAIIHLCQTRLD